MPPQKERQGWEIPDLELLVSGMVQKSRRGREAALERVKILDPTKPFMFEADVPKWKKKIDAISVGLHEYRKSLAGELKALACSGDKDALHVVRGLVKSGRIQSTGEEAPALIEAIIKPNCPVSAALTGADKPDPKNLPREEPFGGI